MKMDVVFVCQHGELEIMACLLAASLRQSCGREVYLHVIEPVPPEEYGSISPAVRNFLNGLEVKWYSFRNPISDEYKIFNKLNCFNIEAQYDKILFLDSDIVARHAFLRDLAVYCKRPFAARSAARQRFSAAVEAWEPVYRLFDLPVPRMRWPAFASQEWGPPYFNAGVILVDASLEFSRHWIDTCARIHHDAGLAVENRGTVQIGLPVVPYRLNIPYALLDERFNYGLNKARLKKRKARALQEAHLVHYFKAENIAGDPVIHREVGQVVDNFKLQEIFSLHPAWRELLDSFAAGQAGAFFGEAAPSRSSLVRFDADAPQRVAARVPARAAEGVLAKPMAFITGIPGSGAELFSSLLARMPGIAKWSETAGPGAPAELPPFDQLRKMLERGQAEMAPGSRAEKDSEGSARASSAPDRVLTAANSLHFLTWLQHILQSFPQAAVFVLVRHPFETVASWMNQPALWQAAFIDEDEQAGVAGPLLRDEQRRHLAALQGVADAAMKRAGLWDYFAALAHQHEERIQIFRYEDLVSKPAAVLEHAYRGLFPDAKAVAPPDLSIRNGQPGKEMAEWDRECLRVICSNYAGLWGYDLYAD